MHIAVAGGWVVVLLAGCGGEPSPLTTRVGGALGANRKVDILFMVDNSSGMSNPQANLVKNMSLFMNALKALPDGLPDVHIAVVTSDMGAGDGSITGCSGNGRNGVFQAAARTANGLPACTDTTLSNGATFISDTGGAAPETNFGSPDITAVLQCILPVGASGCGFEHQLASVVRALGADGAPAPPENAGFLRSDALLAIVLLTNEDDCSAPVTSELFADDAQHATLTSPLGPPNNYRCNEYGHLCGSPAAPPPRLSPNPGDLTTTVALDDCQSNENSPYLPSVASLAGQIKSLKRDSASQIIVASLIAPVTPYAVRWTNPPSSDTGPWPGIIYSCDGGTVSGFADPGVRLAQWTHEFGSNGLVYSFCAVDYGPALTEIATRIAEAPAAGTDAGEAGMGGAGDGAGDGGGGSGGAGCGCELSGGRGGAWGLALLALVAPPLLKRRRRRATRPPE